MSPELFNAHTRPPLLFVTHLPSASSFYASIIQPLGLQFLSSPPVQTIPPTPAVLNYGYITQGPAGLKHVVVFSVTQGRPGAIRPAKIGLSACSEAAVKEFWKKSALLNKGVRTPGKLDYLVENEEEGGAEIVVSRTRDFDGNMLEAVYRRGDRGYGGGGGGGIGYRPRREAIEMSPAEKEARRVLEWQEQVARSIGDSGSTGGAASVISSSDIVDDGYRPVARRADSYPVQGSERQVPMRLVRRETTTTEHYRRPDERESGARGVSGKAVIGTLLGAAAGAAFAYAMVRSESPERERRPPAAMRRASYGNQTHYTQVVQSPREKAPPRSYVSARGEGGPRYDVQYLDAAPRVHQIDNKSYVSERPNRSVRGASSARSRSEVGSRYDRPLTIQPARSQSRARSPSRSHVSQRSSYRTAKEGSPSRSRRTESHVSARSHHSHHSHSTAKQSPPPATSTIKIRSVPSEGSRRTMHSGYDGYERDVERARHVPLPVSIVSGTGYAASVAPSDSVSSIGIKRERERLRDRMSVRDSRGPW
jgi:hypothetical protein